MKSQILARTNTFMTYCQVFTVDKVNSYITTILSSMQNSNANDVAQALNNYLDDVYTQKKNFIFYVAQNFDRRNTVKFGYWGGGLQSSIVNGVWTVYWAATPIWPEHDVQRLNVDGGNLLKTLTTAPVKSALSRDANYVYNYLVNGNPVSGRSTALWIVVLYHYLASKSSASVGNPTRLNSYYNRFAVMWPGGYNPMFGIVNVPWAVDVVIQ